MSQSLKDERDARGRETGIFRSLLESSGNRLDQVEKDMGAYNINKVLSTLEERVMPVPGGSSSGFVKHQRGVARTSSCDHCHGGFFLGSAFRDLILSSDFLFALWWLPDSASWCCFLAATPVLRSEAVAEPRQENSNELAQLQLAQCQLQAQCSSRSPTAGTVTLASADTDGEANVSASTACVTEGDFLLRFEAMEAKVEAQVPRSLNLESQILGANLGASHGLMLIS